NYLAMEVACTLNCPRSNKEVLIKQPDGTETQKCEKCEGDCAKDCYGLGMDNLGVTDNHSVTIVTSANVGHFSKCSKIFGSLAFRAQSFARDPVTNTSGLTLEQLRAFRKLEEITGTRLFVNVSARFYQQNMTDLNSVAWRRPNKSLRIAVIFHMQVICTSMPGQRSGLTSLCLRT
ncbi:hypothetical protein ILYODFUR_007745, partial [Ilyodon furcidens]